MLDSVDGQLVQDEEDVVQGRAVGQQVRGEGPDTADLVGSAPEFTPPVHRGFVPGGDGSGEQHRSPNEIHQIAIPGIVQIPEFIRALVDLDRADGPLPYDPERMVEARLQRKEVALRPDGPQCHLILDEFLLRRLAVPREVMRAQLLHLVEVASSKPRLRLRVLGIDARVKGGFSAKSPFTVYRFPDPSDPSMAVADTVNTDVVHTDVEDVRRYIELHARLWEASLSEVKSLTLLEATSNRLAKLAGS